MKAQDSDGDPGSQTGCEALQFVCGSESGVHTPSPVTGVPLLIDSRTFDLATLEVAAAFSSMGGGKQCAGTKFGAIDKNPSVDTIGW